MFNSFTEIASAFNNLDKLQDGTQAKVSEDSNNNSSSNATAKKGAVDDSAAEASSFPSLTSLTSITDDAMNSISLATSSFNLFGPSPPSTSTTNPNPKVNTVYIKDTEAEDAFKEEIIRLKVQLEEAMYKIEEKGNELYKIEVSHQLASQNFEYKIRESEIEIQSLKGEIQDQSKHFEDKLNELQMSRVASTADTTEGTTNNADTVAEADTVSKQEFNIIQEKSAIVEKKLQATQTALERKERENKEMKAELDKREKELKDAKQEAKSELERKEKECRDLKQEVEQKNTELKATRKEFKRKEKEFHDSVDKKTADLQSLTLQYDTTRKDLSAAKEAVEDSKRQVSTLQGELQTQQSRIELRDGSVLEQQEKVKTLTEKLRELMKKYTDLKVQYKTLEQSKLDSKKVEVDETLHAKESELLGIKLKLENTTQQFQEETRVRIQITDKYGEAQRGIARMKESLESGKLTVTELKKENTSLLAKVNEFTQQSKSLSETNSQLEIKVSRLTAELAKVKQQAQEQLEALTHESEDRVSALESEVQSLQSRVSTEEESASLLDQYKKRAQAAIKKANDQIHELNIEVERLKIDLSNAQESALGDAVAVKQAALSIQNLEVELEKSQNELSAQSTRLIELEASFDAVKLQASIRDQENAAKIIELTEALRIAEDSLQIAVTTVYDAAATAPQNADKHIDITYTSAASILPSVPDSQEESSPQKEVVITESQVEKIANRQLKLRAETHHTQSPTPSSSDPQLFLVNELYSKLDELRKQVGVTDQANVELQSELITEKEITRSLQVRAEELTAILDRTRQLRDDPDSQINTEYLKNCIYKYMICTDLKDKLRLSNVVCAVLKLTDKEKIAVKEVLDRESSSIVGVGVPQFDESLTSFASMATTSFESLFGTPFSSTAPTQQGRPPTAPVLQPPEASASAGIVPTDLFSSLFSTPVRK